jgi:DNA helicase HerA-like ATPase
MTIKLPSSDNRTAVIGSTGSGKTQFSVWLLSTRDFTRRPWVIFDFKGDALLEDIGAKEITLHAPPKEPGLYIVRPLPGDEYLVSNFFYKCWAQENVGIYIDEGYMVPKNDRWFRACLTQGRSKHIEMIVCSQRPVFLDKFVFTESNFFVIFNMNYAEDRKHVAAYLDNKRPGLLPKYHSLWYNVGDQRSNVLGPVPDAETLIATFQKRLDNKPVKI